MTTACRLLVALLALAASGTAAAKPARTRAAKPPRAAAVRRAPAPAAPLAAPAPAPTAAGAGAGAPAPAPAPAPDERSGSRTRLPRSEGAVAGGCEDPSAKADGTECPPGWENVAAPQDAEPVRVTATYDEAAEPPARGGWLDGFHLRLGALLVAPTGRGAEVEMANTTEMAHLSGVRDGPIAGSSTSLGNALMPAAILGYAPPLLGRHLAIETILALPFKQKLYAEGSLADTSLAPTALGTLPTGVPPLGRELGEVKLLPPVVTAVYRPFLGRFRPYLGAGGCLLVVLDARITNPVLSSVRAPEVEIPPRWGWVLQAGAELRFGTGTLLPGRSFYLTADVKYVGGLDVTARLKNIWVSVPDLPVYGAVKVGDNVARISVDPLITFFGLGVDL